jgi:hypothetical protein
VAGSEAEPAVVSTPASPLHSLVFREHHLRTSQAAFQFLAPWQIDVAGNLFLLSRMAEPRDVSNGGFKA